MADDNSKYCHPDDPDLCAAEDALQAALDANEGDTSWVDDLPELPAAPTGDAVQAIFVPTAPTGKR